MVIVSLFTAPPAREQWEPFLWRPSLLTNLDDGTVRPWYKSLILWFGVFAGIWFYLYWHYW